MKLYTIDIAVNKIESSQYISSLSGETKKKTLDRYCYFIHLILKSHIRDSLDFKYYSNIHSHDLKVVMGREYKDIINNLVKLDIVDQNENYKVGRFTKSYRLNPELFEHGKIQNTEIQSKWLKSKIEQAVESQIDISTKDSLLKRILENTMRLHLIDEPTAFQTMKEFVKSSSFQITKDAPILNFGVYVSNPNRVFRYEEFRRALINLNSYTDIGKLMLENAYYQPSVANSGRVYHMVASIPRKIRKGLRTKENEPIFEVDMASAQPSILMLEWIRLTKDRLGQLEMKNCLELIINGGIYDHISKNSKYYQELEYNELKKQVLTALNYKNHAIKSAIELSKVFPSFMAWIKEIKELNDHKYVSQVGQSKEAEIFVEVYKRLPRDIFSLIIHDSILTTEKHIKLVKHMLSERVKTLYKDILPEETSLDKLFKSDRVSFTDEQLSDKNWIKHVCSDQSIIEAFMEDEYLYHDTYKSLE